MSATIPSIVSNPIANTLSTIFLIICLALFIIVAAYFVFVFAAVETDFDHLDVAKEDRQSTNIVFGSIGVVTLVGLIAGAFLFGWEWKYANRHTAATETDVIVLTDTIAILSSTADSPRAVICRHDIEDTMEECVSFGVTEESVVQKINDYLAENELKILQYCQSGKEFFVNAVHQNANGTAVTLGEFQRCPKESKELKLKRIQAYNAVKSDLTLVPCTKRDVNDAVPLNEIPVRFRKTGYGTAQFYARCPKTDRLPDVHDLRIHLPLFKMISQSKDCSEKMSWINRIFDTIDIEHGTLLAGALVSGAQVRPQLEIQQYRKILGFYGKQ